MWINLVHMSWNIALFVNYAWSYLSNVHINHKTVVSINFEKFILGQRFSFNVMLNIDMLVWKNHIWMSKFISWGLSIENSEVFVHFIGVIREVVVTIGGDLSESVVS